MFKVVKKLSYIKSAVNSLLLSLLFLGTNAVAKIPEIQDPKQGKQAGFFDNMQAFLYDGVVLGGIIIVSVIFILTIKNAISEYNKIGDERGTWTKLAIIIVVGVTLIVASIWLVSMAAETLKL
ncbi:TIGR03745 family integrating conjugative element membrane protein [Orbus sturtevantii]|uniref:TIGR03745 family integrating conjugative element membrane protein n=1 Tax=Orbus sturtevantii TaxID=3074109 RepID=UPI00370DA6A0